jgi:hypothetical protein
MQLSALAVRITKFPGRDYQLNRIPLIAPPPPLAPPAVPKKTGSSFLPLWVVGAAQARSNNDAARTKSAAAEAICLREKSAIFSLIHSPTHARLNVKALIVLGVEDGFTTRADAERMHALGVSAHRWL